MIINCEERYREALEYAKSTGDKTLDDCFKRLEQYEKNWECTAYVRKDFAPYSFYFDLLDKEGKRVMNGGILYHGNPDKSQAIQLEPSIGWQIHT